MKNVYLSLMTLVFGLIAVSASASESESASVCPMHDMEMDMSAAVEHSGAIAAILAADGVEGLSDHADGMAKALGVDGEGHDMKGHDMKGHDMEGQDMEGHHVKGQDMAGQDMKGHDMEGHDMEGHDMEGQDMAGHDMKGMSSGDECPHMAISAQLAILGGESVSIDNARDAFLSLQEAFIPLAEKAYSGQDGETEWAVYYCSMAKGSWIQPSGEIANPFLGSKMSTCGEKVTVLGETPAEESGDHGDQGDH